MPSLLFGVVLLGAAAPAAGPPLAVTAAPAAAPTASQPQRLAQAGQRAESVIVTAADDGRSLNLRRGEQLWVVLGEIAGTGYSWQIETLDQRLLRFEGQRSWQDPGPPPPPGLKGPVGLVGGPQQVSLLFRAIAVGEGDLVLRHWRPWEGPRSVDRRLRLRLRVVE